MKRKIIIFSILAVFTLVAISISSVISTENNANYSPLFTKRVKQAIKTSNDMEQSSDVIFYVRPYSKGIIQVPALTEQELDSIFCQRWTKGKQCQSWLHSCLPFCHCICKLNTLIKLR